MSFSSQMSKGIDNIKKKSYLFHQKKAIDLFTDCIVGTPVDSGRAKGNWVATYNVPFPSQLDVTDKASKGSSFTTVSNMISDVAEFDGVRVNNVILANNMPYMYRLEFEGWSDQQEFGWIRSAIQKAKS